MIADSRERRVNKTSEFTCEEFEYKSSSKSLLGRHRETQHKIIYPCNQCEYKATTKEDLSEHKASHQEEIIHQCNQCEYKASTKNKLKEHIENIHGAIKKQNPIKKYTAKRLKCDKCERKFNKVETFEKHLNMDHKEDNQSKLNFQIKLRSQVKPRNDLPNENELTLNQQNQR